MDSLYDSQSSKVEMLAEKDFVWIDAFSTLGQSHRVYFDTRDCLISPRTTSLSTVSKLPGHILLFLLNTKIKKRSNKLLVGKSILIVKLQSEGLLVCWSCNCNCNFNCNFHCNCVWKCNWKCYLSEGHFHFMILISGKFNLIH